MVALIGDSSAFTINWNRWDHIYFLPPSTSSLLWICLRPQRFRGLVTLIAPLLPTLPWCLNLLSWCSNLLPLRDSCLMTKSLSQLGVLEATHLELLQSCLWDHLPAMDGVRDAERFSGTSQLISVSCI